MGQDLRTLSKATGVNFAIVGGTWALGFLLVRVTELIAGRGASPWALLVAAVLGVVATVRFRARVAMLILLGVSAYLSVELTARSAFGEPVLQGRGNHLAALAIAFLAVGLGFLSTRVSRAAPN